jgi:hypothetical protein
MEKCVAFVLVAILMYRICARIDRGQLAGWFRGTRCAAALRWFAKNLFGG